MKLPKIEVYLKVYREAYPAEYYLTTVNVYGEYSNRLYTSNNMISQKVRSLLQEQSKFYASIKEPTCKLIEYIEKNPESIEFTDSTEIIEDWSSGCISMKRNIKQLIINNQNITLDCFNRNELSLIEQIMFEVSEINKEKVKPENRATISAMIDRWNNIDE